MKKFLSWAVFFLLTSLLVILVSLLITYVGLLYIKYGFRGARSIVTFVFGGTGVFGMALCMVIWLCGLLVTLSQKISVSKNGIRYYVYATMLGCYALRSLYTLATGIYVTKYPMLPIVMYVTWLICAIAIIIYGRKAAKGETHSLSHDDL